jgi:hypothetical protein
MNLFSPWYSWKIAELASGNNIMNSMNFIYTYIFICCHIKSLINITIWKITNLLLTSRLYYEYYRLRHRTKTITTNTTTQKTKKMNNHGPHLKMWIIIKILLYRVIWQKSQTRTSYSETCLNRTFLEPTFVFWIDKCSVYTG